MRKIRVKACICLIMISLIFLGACGRGDTVLNPKKKELSIVTSFYPIYAVTQEIAGDINDVRMIGSKNGIHSFEPSPADVKAIDDADVFVYHSSTLEGWTKNLKENFEKATVKIIEGTDGIQLQKVKGLEDIEATDGIDEKSLYDPHSWLDPQLISDEAGIIAEKLGEIDPKNKQKYLDNAKEFQNKALELLAKYDKRFKNIKKRTFVTQHTAFSYIANRYQLNQLGISGIEDEEPSPRRIAEILEFVKENKIKTIFAEPQTSNKKAKVIADATGVVVKTLDPLEADPQNDKTFLENLDKTLETIANDLAEK
ncbi:metal ABC transporter substrate-binding protein [Streptococcus pluranimalium]|uniref:metal ABC transporter substrate-binding protein n=1 Tax=Streptococcus pluranimalium TaxID=82348 RepID=UPI003F6941A0